MCLIKHLDTFFRCLYVTIKSPSSIYIQNQITTTNYKTFIRPQIDSIFGQYTLIECTREERYLRLYVAVSSLMQINQKHQVLIEGSVRHQSRSHVSPLQAHHPHILHKESCLYMKPIRRCSQKHKD